MGRTPKPLTMVVDRRIADWPEIIKLQEQGHTIIVWDYIDIDMVLGPLSHRMDESIRKWLPEAIKAIRLRRYPKDITDDKEE